MKTLPFKSSKIGSIGIELELQIVDPKTFYLISRSKDLIRSIKEERFQHIIKPEITQSMIELNSSIHYSTESLCNELKQIQSFLLAKAALLDIAICGGGTHPNFKWSRQKIFPTPRYKKISHKFRFLSKRSTVFGQHIHFGCGSAANALYLTHALARYTPHFIAISASSPFYQGIDTGYACSRLNIFNAFPQSGHIPQTLLSWPQFSEYFYKMRNLGIIVNMKDFYWDIRPKPEFGTVEIRVCDTPLKLFNAIRLAAYVQALCFFLLQERPDVINPDLYYIYTHNRFHASRYGFEGQFINPFTLKSIPLIEDILETIHQLSPYANQFANANYFKSLMEDVSHKQNDTMLLRKLYKEKHSFLDVVHEQCKLWSIPLS